MSRKAAVILIILAAVAVAGYVVTTGIQSNLEQLALSPIEDVDLSAIQDGTYDGSCEVFPVSVDVRVTVLNHRITQIELVKHTHGRGAAAEAIPDQVLRRQTLEVDAVSGATYSSKAILKAIENALIGADD